MFLDLTKAFDTVNHTGLHKRERFGIRAEVYLNGFSFCPDFVHSDKPHG